MLSRPGGNSSAEDLTSVDPLSCLGRGRGHGRGHSWRMGGVGVSGGGWKFSGTLALEASEVQNRCAVIRSASSWIDILRMILSASTSVLLSVLLSAPLSMALSPPVCCTLFSLMSLSSSHPLFLLCSCLLVFLLFCLSCFLFLCFCSCCIFNTLPDQTESSFQRVQDFLHVLF
ncbi:hypothetical protein FB446DRAFT_103456 [Lentinula raphanica]|nr:hypothetical protein FB446DRAFT_103456 [Lentinula raphanica]